MVTINLGEAFGNLARRGGKGGTRPQKYRYITYGEPPSSPARAHRKSMTRSQFRPSIGQNSSSKDIKSLTVLPANDIANCSNSTIIVKNQMIPMRQPKGSVAVEAIYTIQNGSAKNSHFQSRMSNRRNRKQHDARRSAWQKNKQHGTPKQKKRGSRNPAQKRSVKPLSRNALTVDHSNQRVGSKDLKTNSQNITSSSSTPSSVRHIQSSPSTILAPRSQSTGNAPKVPPLALGSCIDSQRANIKSSRRRGNKASPDPYYVSSARTSRKAWEEHPRSPGVDESRFRPPRSPVGIKGPSLSLTRRKGAFRYSITTTTNTPETVRTMKKPDPVSKTYRRLLPYSNVTKRSESWAKHISKGLKKDGKTKGGSSRQAKTTPTPCKISALEE